mgnify:CR=1 FL=1
MTTNHVIIPRPLTEAVPAIQGLVDQYRETSDLQHSTISISLANVGEAVFDTTYTMLVHFPHWDTPPALEHRHAYRYLSGDIPVCTDVGISAGVHIQHTRVTSDTSVNLHLRNHGGACASVVVKTPVDATHIPSVVFPDSVTLTSQYMFTKTPWTFVMSRAWTGESRTAAEIAQAKAEPVHRVEVRFAPPPGYWDIPHHTSTYVATSMLMKLVDLVSAEMVGVEVIES